MGALVALALLATPAEARTARHAPAAKPNPVVALVRGYNPSLPTFMLPTAVGMPICAASGLMIAAARAHPRPLKNRVAYQIVGGCLLPFVGGYIVKHFTDQHPEWDTMPHKVLRREDIN